MKILYVEDELKIDTILAIFKNQLGKSKKGLEELKIKQRVQDDQKIKEIVESSGVIDVEFNFANALEKIINHHDDYKLFIVDRNLNGNGNYNLEDIQKVYSKYTEKLQKQYLEREGDYLLTRLALAGVDCRPRFYFMTANTDALRSDEIDYLLEFNRYSEDNMIDKSDDKQVERLINIISDTKSFDMRVKYYDIFEIFDREILDIEFKNELVYCINNMHRYDLPSINSTVAKLRKLLESIFIELNKLDDEIVPTEYVINMKKSNRTEVKSKDIINYLKENNYIEKCSHIDKFMWNLYTLTSDIIHPQYSKSNIDISKYSVQSLVFAMFDILLWFKKMYKNK